MKIILLLLCLSICSIGCSKYENLDNKKSSAASVYFLKPKPQFPCGNAEGLENVLLKSYPTFYNAEYRKYLAAEVNYPSQGPWHGSQVLLKNWEDSRKWRDSQRWTLEQQPKLGPNGGFVFIFKVGKNYCYPEYTMTHNFPNGKIILLKNPDETFYSTRFEFVVIECKGDSKFFYKVNSRGYLIDLQTNLMIKADSETPNGRIIAQLGVDYKDFNTLSKKEQRQYSWEASGSTYYGY